MSYSILKKNISTLKEASRDNHNKIDYFMTESKINIIDFDAVKDDYIRNLKLKEKPKSNDALLQSSNGDLAFIEFKNGRIDNSLQFSLKRKIFDSLLILTDIIDIGISHTRNEMDYILVYNETKNTISDEQTTKVQVSESRDFIAKELAKLGGTTHTKFGLEMFKKYCFRDVFTYTEVEFEIFLSKLKI